MRVWIRSLFLLIGLLSQPHFAADREATFALWSQQELVPWFNSQPDQFLASAVPSSKPVQLRYKTFLQAKARANIVLVHGYGERMEKFMEMIYDFHESGYNVYAFDQRGFGRSTRLNPEEKDSIYVQNFADYVKDLEQFLVKVVRAQGPKPTFLFAHSMGGLVSTMLLHDRPDLVDGAVLSAPMHRIKTNGVPQKMALLLTCLADKLGFGASYAFGQVGPRKPEFTSHTGTQSLARWQQYADFYSSPAEWPLSLGGSSFRWLVEALRGTQLIDNDEWASSIQTPVLLFQAEHDTFVENEGQDAFCLRARNCRKIFMPGTRHELYREQDVARGPYMLSIWQFLEEQLQSPGHALVPHP